MPSFKSATDIYMTYRFIRALVTPFEKTKAYEYGIIDADGNPLKKKRDLKTKEEKNSYTVYERLIFKLKRLIEKIPGGKSRLASFAAALWLIKENVCGGSDEAAYLIEEDIAQKLGMSQHDYDVLLESAPSQIMTGQYVLTDEYISEVFDGVSVGDVVSVTNPNPVANILGVTLFEAEHRETKQKVVVSNETVQAIFI